MQKTSDEIKKHIQKSYPHCTDEFLDLIFEYVCKRYN